MGEPALNERGLGRRQHERFALRMRARLITLDGTVAVSLENLSAGGAKVILPEPHDFVVCVLRWMDFHCFAEVRWRDGLSVGLQFDKPLSAEVMYHTRRAAPDVVQQPQPCETIRSC